MKQTSSRRSPPFVVKERLIARSKLQTAMPAGVCRSSGSRVRFPSKITLLKLTIPDLPGSCDGATPERGLRLRLKAPFPRLLSPDNHPFQDGLRNPKMSLEIGHNSAHATHLHQDVLALPPLLHLVGQSLFPPLLHLQHLPTFLGDDLANSADLRLDTILCEGWVQNDNDLVLVHSLHLLRITPCELDGHLERYIGSSPPQDFPATAPLQHRRPVVPLPVSRRPHVPRKTRAHALPYPVRPEAVGLPPLLAKAQGCPSPPRRNGD